MTLTAHDITAISAALADQLKAELMTKMTFGRWLTLNEAKHYARVKSTNTIMSWINDGLIYGKKAGGWKIDRESIDNFLLSDKF